VFPAVLFRLGAVQGFPVSFFVTSFFENGSKKTVDFSHIATSQRSVFGYSVFSNLPAANGLSKPFADGKSTGDKRFRDETFALRQAPIIIEDSANERIANTIPH